LVPVLGLYSTQKHRDYNTSGKGQRRLPVSQKEDAKYFAPGTLQLLHLKEIILDQTEAQTQCVNSGRETHLLLFPFRLCLLHMLYPLKEPPEENPLGFRQLLCRFLPSAVPPSMNKSALISAVQCGQGQVQCDTHSVHLARTSCVHIWTELLVYHSENSVQLKILCQIPQDMLNKTQY